MNWLYERDPDLLSEAALAEAQTRMDQALTDSRMGEDAMTAHVGQNVRHLLSSQCNLTVRTLGRFLAICGYRLNVDIKRIPTTAALPAAPEAGSVSSLGGVSRLPAPDRPGAVALTFATA